MTPEVLEKVKKLNTMAEARGQSLAEMSLAWLLKDKRVMSVLIGASRVSQLEDNFGATKCLDFSSEELAGIEGILRG